MNNGAPPSDVPMTLFEHVAELRRLLFVFVSLFFAALVGAHYFHEQIIEFILAPLASYQTPLQFLSPLDPLFFILKIDVMVALLFLLPVFGNLLWFYIAPALNGKRRLPLLFTLAVIAGTILGVVYAYKIVIPTVLTFMSTIVIAGTTLAFTANEYLSFFLAITLIMVLIFQLPILVVFLVYSRLITVEQITKKRTHWYLGIIVLMAILTPTTDVLTLFLTSLPAILAIEIGVISARILVGKKL